MDAGWIIYKGYRIARYNCLAKRIQLFKRSHHASEREIAEKTAADEASTSAPAEEENLSDVDDEEIDAMLLSPEEIKLKTTIWYTANKDYIEEMKAKARKIEMDKQNGVYTKRGVSSYIYIHIFISKSSKHKRDM